MFKSRKSDRVKGRTSSSSTENARGARNHSSYMKLHERSNSAPAELPSVRPLQDQELLDRWGTTSYRVQTDAVGGDLCSVETSRTSPQISSLANAIDGPPLEPVPSIDSTSSIHSSTSSPSGHKSGKGLRFNDQVAVGQTWSPSSYDRSSIDVDPLTRDDYLDVIEFRRQMHAETDKLIGQALRPQRSRHHSHDIQAVELRGGGFFL